MIKKKLKRGLLLVAAAAAVMVLLTACSDTGNTTGQGAGSGSSSGSAAGTVTGGQDTAQDVPGADSAGAGQPSDTVSGTQGDAGASDGGTQGSDASPSQDGAADAQAPAGTDDGGSADAGAQIIEDGPDEASDGSESDIWSGTYKSDSESVTLSQVDSGNVSFSFAQAGISGTASVKSSGQAVFNGDDYHVVIFTISGSVLDVSVASEEDFDASGSPLIGTYIKSE